MLRPLWGLCALSLFIHPVPTRAQEIVRSEPVSPSDEPELSLETLLQLAAKNNPQPQIAQANFEAAQARAKALSASPDPVLQIVPALGGTRDSRDEEILLSQSVDLFGRRRAQRNVLAAEAERVQAEVTLANRTLETEIKDAVARLFAAQEAESLGVSQVEVARAFRDAAARKAQLGDVPPVQVQRADLELSRAQNELESARAERLIRRVALNQLVGQKPQTPLRVSLPTSSELTAENSLLLQTQLPDALKNRPDLVGAEATLEARRANVNAIGRSRFPQFEIQARRNGVFDSPASTSLRAVITMPLFDFGSVKSQKQAAQAEVRAQESEIELLRSQVAVQVESALVRLQQQRVALERYRTSIVPQSLDLLRKTQIGYAQGASTYLEVLEAQRATRQVQSEYLQALVGVRSAENTLESAIGSTLPHLSNASVPNPSASSISTPSTTN